MAEGNETWRHNKILLGGFFSCGNPFPEFITVDIYDLDIAFSLTVKRSKIPVIQASWYPPLVRVVIMLIHILVLGLRVA